MMRFQSVSDCLLRGSAPTPEELLILKDIWGVNRVVSLDLEAGLAVQDACKQMELEHLIIPIENKDLKSTLDFIVANIPELFSKDNKTFVHCHWGKDRTGLAVGMYRVISEGWSFEKALQEALTLNFGSGLSKNMRQLFIQYLHKACDIAKSKSSEEDENDAMAQVGVGESGATQIWRGWNPGGRASSFHYDFNI